MRTNRLCWQMCQIVRSHSCYLIFWKTSAFIYLSLYSLMKIDLFFTIYSRERYVFFLIFLIVMVSKIWMLVVETKLEDEPLMELMNIKDEVDRLLKVNEHIYCWFEIWSLGKIAIFHSPYYSYNTVYDTVRQTFCCDIIEEWSFTHIVWEKGVMYILRAW